MANMNVENLDENNQDEVVEEEATQEESAQENVDMTALELADLKNQMSSLLATQNKLLESLTPKQRDELTDEQVQELQKNPKKLFETIQGMVDSKVKTLVATDERKRTDSRVFEEYPALKTNPQFQKAVVNQMNEFIANGEYTADHPLLTLRAAQLVAGKMNVKKDQPVAQRNQVSAASPNQIRSSSQGKVKISDNDPRVVMAREMGMDDKKIAAFKAQLPAYVAPEKARGKTLLRRK